MLKILHTVVCIKVGTAQWVCLLNKRLQIFILAILTKSQENCLNLPSPDPKKEKKLV